MSSVGYSPAAGWRAYPHIVLALSVVAAILIVRGASPAYFSLLIAVAASAVVFPPFRKLVDFSAKCVTPILMGLLFVMIYFQVYQTQEIFGYNIKDNVGLEATEILKLAQFNDDYREPFYTAISTLYAIILALALVKGMEDVDELRLSIAEETHRIRSIWNYLKYFEDNELDLDSRIQRDTFRHLLLDYLKNIPRGPGTGNPERNRVVLDGCRMAVLGIEPFDRDDRIAQEEIMRSLETIGIMRAKRLGANNSKISSYLMAALWIMSLALLLPFLAEPLCVSRDVAREQMQIANVPLGPTLPRAYTSEKTDPQRGLDQRSALRAQLDAAMTVCAFKNGAARDELVLSPLRFSQYYMIFIIVSFFSFLMFMLHDLSSPDKGFWRVDHGAFEELRRELQRELARLPKAPVLAAMGYGLGLPERVSADDHGFTLLSNEHGDAWVRLNDE